MTGKPRQPATGEQFELARSDARATITELAGGLRRYEKQGVQLTESYADGEVPPLASGILLAPWPNRVAGARWELDGKTLQLDVTEPSRGHAIHGLLRNSGYRPLDRTAASVLLQAEIFPQHGYPFRLSHRAGYALDEDGDLTVTQQLTNHSAVPAPVALGAHPFLRLGGETVERVALTVPAARCLEADRQTMIPTAEVPVSPATDLRGGAALAGLELDRAYTELGEGPGQRAMTTLASPNGSWVGLWQDNAFPYVHIFATARYPGRERAVAVEPMSAPANALNSGRGLVWLEPGGCFGGSWGIISRQLHGTHVAGPI